MLAVVCRLKVDEQHFQRPHKTNLEAQSHNNLVKQRRFNDVCCWSLLLDRLVDGMTRNMRVLLGELQNLADASRYLISLSTGSSLVLFKLSHLPRDACPQTATTTNTDGVHDYFCMNQECPHAGGPMEDSELTYDVEDDAWIASCPWHSYDFNVETGESSFGVKTCTYPVTVDRQSVWIELPHENDKIVSIISVTPVSETFRMSALNQVLPATSQPTKTTATTARDSALESPATLSEWCTHILNTPDCEDKAALTHRFFSMLQEQPDMPIGGSTPPDTPPRNALKAIPPGQMPKPGRAGTIKSRIAILHSLANIEQWAIDLALDICARFASFRTLNGTALPQQFFLDWIRVANDEAKHFSLLRGRLQDLGSDFGALPVHHGLWDSAAITAHDLRARISIIALVHEARGLDVNPATIRKFENAADEESAAALRIIHADEVTHVTTGHRWLSWICEQEQKDPVAVFRENVSKYFMGAVKGPFNVKDRETAGLEEGYYVNLNGRPKTVLVAGG